MNSQKVRIPTRCELYWSDTQEVSNQPGSLETDLASDQSDGTGLGLVHCTSSV